MDIIRAKIVQIQGVCNAGLKVGDEFIVKDWEILPCKQENTCSLAFASIVNNAGRVRIYPNPIFISCPDPGTGEGGNVIFELSIEKK